MVSRVYILGTLVSIISEKSKYQNVSVVLCLFRTYSELYRLTALLSAYDSHTVFTLTTLHFVHDSPGVYPLAALKCFHNSQMRMQLLRVLIDNLVRSDHDNYRVYRVATLLILFMTSEELVGLHGLFMTSL